MAEEKKQAGSGCYCIKLRRAANAVTKLYDNEMKPTGLTLNQYSLLSSLYRLQPASITELAGAVKLERTTVTRNVKPLFNMELIQDVSDEGTRDRKMRLTELGLTKRQECAICWSRVQQKLEAAMGAEELSALMEKLRLLEELG